MSMLAIMLIFAFATYSVNADDGYDGRTAGNPIITSIFTADPSAHVWPSDPTRLFVYPSQDMFPAIGCDLMDRYHVFSTDNMVDWVNHGEILRRADLCTDYWGEMYPNSYFMWAPDAAYRVPRFVGDTGPYFFFFPVNVGASNDQGNTWGNNWKIGVAHSNCPVSGFRDNEIVSLRDYNGNPIRGTGVLIDPSIFWDPYCTEDGNPGNHYLVVGGSAQMRVARLEPCMTQLAEPWTIFNNTQLPHFHEGPWMFDRVNDHGQRIFYAMYAADNAAWPNVSPHGGALAYAFSTYGPFGPWTYGGAILAPSVTTDTTHGSIVEFLGQWYLFYHTDVLSMGQNNLRSTSVDRLFFDADGRILPVTRTETSVPSVGPPTCTDYLDNRFGAGNWTMEIPFRDLVGDDVNFDDFVLNHVYSVLHDSVIVGGGAIKNSSTQIIQNLHIAGAYVEFTNVDGGMGGNALLQVVYGLGGNGGLARVTVNGTHVHAMRVAPSGGWYAFTDTMLMVELEPGTENTIRIDSFAFNIHSLSVLHGIIDVNVPSEQQVYAAAGSLTWDRIRLENSAQSDVTTDLRLPIRLAAEGLYDATVTWASSHPDIISTSGIITRPRDASVDVTLTATISVGGNSQPVTFNLTVTYYEADTGGGDVELIRLIPGPDLGDARHNGADRDMEWEAGNSVVGWIRPWAWIRFEDVDLQNGIESFMVRYARGVGPTPANFQLWVAPPGSPTIPGPGGIMNLPVEAVQVGGITWTTTNTGGWGIPGNTVYTDIIANSGEGLMDVYAVFVQGEWNFAYVALELANDSEPPCCAEYPYCSCNELPCCEDYPDCNCNELPCCEDYPDCDCNELPCCEEYPGCDCNELPCCEDYPDCGCNELPCCEDYPDCDCDELPCCEEYPDCNCNELPCCEDYPNCNCVEASDFSALQTLINQTFGLNPIAYTQNSWANLLAARTAAQALIAGQNATQAEIDAAHNALQLAVNALVSVSLGSQQLPPQQPQPPSPQPPQPPSTDYVSPSPPPFFPLVQRQPQPPEQVYPAPDAYAYIEYGPDSADAQEFVEAIIPVSIPLPPPAATESRLVFTISNIQYMLNGNARTSVGVPFIDPATDRMMIPLRTLAEAMGVEVDWDSATRSAIVFLPTGTLIIPADEMLPDGMGSAIIVSDRVFIPLRFVMYALNATVEWDSANRAAIISW